MGHPRATYAILGIIVVGLFFLAWRMWTYDPLSGQPSAEATGAEPLAKEPADPSALSLYSSGENGISFAYPARATLATPADATPGVAGTVRGALRAEALVAELEEGDARLRIRARTAAQDACYAIAPAERAEDPRPIGPRTWRVVTRTALGTEQQRRIVEFRIADGSRCVIVEESRPVGAEDESPLLTTVLSSFELAPAMSAPRE